MHGTWEWSRYRAEADMLLMPASQGGGGDTGWRLDQVKVERRVPPLWEVKE